MEVVDFRLGDLIQLRKAHPCGSFEWDVTRLGGDIGLQCRTCGRHIMLARSVLERRMRQFLARGTQEPVIPGQGVNG
jgi:hypothetical protein